MQNLRTLLSLGHSYIQDFHRFVNSSHIFGLKGNRKRIEAHLLRIAHALEKGMVLPSPSPGFGLEKCNQIIETIRKNLNALQNSSAALIALDSIDALLIFHSKQGIDPKKISAIQVQSEGLRVKIERNSNPSSEGVKQAGKTNLFKAETLKSLPEDPCAFFETRRSVRVFADPSEMDWKALEMAITFAKQAPSVCNRQGGRLTVYTERSLISQALRTQDGNRGFGEGFSALLICSYDNSIFYKPGERNQAFIDGGLYAMNLLMAIHTMGLGACMLNWSQSGAAENRSRKILNIPEEESIIVMIGVGPLKENYPVAVSPRRPDNETVRWNPPLRGAKV